MRRFNRRLTTVMVTTGSLLAAGAAFAAQTAFDDIDLVADANDNAVFQYGFDYGCIDGTSGSEGDTVYSVEDGKLVLPAQSDAFDGALSLYVDGKPFTQPSGTASFNGSNEVRSSSEQLGALTVSRRGDSFPGSPTLRELVKFKNTSKRTVRASALFATEYGSDDETRVAASSSGDHKFDSKDRWGITDDDPTTPSDPVVTLVTHGKGSVLAPRQVGPFSAVDDGNTVDGSDCANDTFSLKLKPKQTAYLMFFLEIHADDAGAVADAKKFNKKGLNAQLLTDIGEGARKKILNWDAG